MGNKWLFAKDKGIALESVLLLFVEAVLIIAIY